MRRFPGIGRTIAHQRSSWYWLASLALVFAAQPVSAINGYFMPGYGAKSIGVAGAGVAMPQDRLTTANNPAGMALVETGLDVSTMMLHPQREGSLDCTGIGRCDRPVADRSKREFFVVPGFGYSRRWREDFTFGVSSYANGGMNTSYGRDFYGEAAQRIAGKTPTPGKLGVDFAQMIIAPSVAYRAGRHWVFGIAPLLMMQKFSVRGLANFAPLSVDGTSLTNRGADYKLGGGVRVGAIYLIRPDVRFGAQYTSPIFVPRYTKYNGLFVDGGKLDSPANFTVGLSWDISSALTVGFDYQRIFYADVDTIGNNGPTAAEFAGNIAAARRLGGAKGLGFGWDNLSVYKIGAIYKPNERLTWRAGWNHCEKLVPDSQALLAPLVPAPMQNDMTAGLSYRLAGGHEISIAYMHSFWSKTENKKSQFFGAPVKAEGGVDAFNVGYARDF